MCKMLDGVESSLKMVKFFLQHFWMLQDVARVWPAPSQHLTTRSNNVARCCVEMLRAFGRAVRRAKSWAVAGCGRRDAGGGLYL